jgi:hypothetical protein
MRHFKDPKFRPLYEALPAKERARADKSFELLKADPKHPSLHFKCIRADLWSARIGLNYRAIAVKDGERFQWFWIGTHAEYDRLLR